MPELPEVESVCRIMRRALLGKKLVDVVLPPDPILLKVQDHEVVRGALLGRTVTGVGRKGKFWWIELDEKPWMFAHLGMTGWIREIGQSSIRLKDMGNAPMDDPEGNPRFEKIRLVAEDGRAIVLTDPRRLARIWLGEDPKLDSRMVKLGPDALHQMPESEIFYQLIRKRKAPLKAILLDQAFLSGIGNYLADEAMYQARLAPKRLGSSLTLEEATVLREKLLAILGHAVEVEADYERFPADWMFHHRWGGKNGQEFIYGQAIVRETVGGRTTAWVPSVQI